MDEETERAVEIQTGEQISTSDLQKIAIICSQVQEVVAKEREELCQKDQKHRQRGDVEAQAETRYLLGQKQKSEATPQSTGPAFSFEELLARIEGTDDFVELTESVATDVTQSGLQPSAVHHLRKLIAKKANVSVGTIVADAKAIIKRVYAHEDQQHLNAAKEVIAFHGSSNLVGTSQFNYNYTDEGVWKQIEDRELKQTIILVAGNESLTKNIIDSILDMTKTLIFRPGHAFDQDRRAINVMNGELHYFAGEWELKPHHRESYRTTQIPVVYDREAKAPRFKQFLMEIFLGDRDKDEKALLVYEMLGYCLLASCEYEKFFILIGPGANGKSVLMDVIAALVGQRHVAAVQPSQFDNRFQRAHLDQKLVNLVTEIAEGHEIADAQLKAIVSGELTTAEHKHKPPFDFSPFCTCVFGTNHMPHTRDFSDALFRRAVILKFNRTFQEAEQDKHLKDKLKEELPGILNLALQALSGVISRGEFTMPMSTQEAKDEWRLQCDQVAQFVGDRCIIGPGLKEFSSKTYAAYKAWADEMGIRRLLNQKNFSSRLVRLGYELGKGTSGTRLIHGLEVS